MRPPRARKSREMCYFTQDKDMRYAPAAVNLLPVLQLYASTQGATRSVLFTITLYGIFVLGFWNQKFVGKLTRVASGHEFSTIHLRDIFKSNNGLRIITNRTKFNSIYFTPNMSGLPKFETLICKTGPRVPSSSAFVLPLRLFRSSRFSGKTGGKRRNRGSAAGGWTLS